MRIAVVTALHRRYALSGLFLGYYEALRVKDVEFGLFCAIDHDDPDMRTIVDQFPAWTHSRGRNDNLCGKWLTSMGKVREWDPDAMLVVGSDDFLNVRYIHRLVTLAKQGHGAIFPQQVYFYDTLTGRLARGSYERVGAGRLLTRPVLEACDWQPWAAPSHSLDGSMDGVVRKAIGEENIHRIERISTFGGVILDVKTKESKNSFESVLGRAERFEDAAAFLPKHFPTVAPYLLDWNE